MYNWFEFPLVIFGSNKINEENPENACIEKGNYYMYFISKKKITIIQLNYIDE